MRQAAAQKVRVGEKIRDRRTGQILVVRNLIYSLPSDPSQPLPVSKFETVAGDVPARLADIPTEWEAR
jgi:hypothetical protein